MEIILCKPWGKDQGDFVRINAAEFDPAVHERYEPDAAPATEDVAPKGKRNKAAPAATTEG